MVEWEIIDIRPLIDIDPAGRFFKLYRVRFVINKKIEDFLDIPEAEFTAEEVRKRVEARVKEIAELMKLG